MRAEKAFQLEKKDLPTGWSNQAQHFINKCLQLDPKKRIGHYKGILELKLHPWFEGFDWVALASREMKPPFKPTLTRVQANYKDKTHRRERRARNLKWYRQQLK